HALYADCGPGKEPIVLNVTQRTGLLLFSLLLALLASCNRDRPAGAVSRAPRTPAPAVAPPAIPQSTTALQDVIERDPRYIIGISYPPIADRYPGLAAELKRYADAARADVMQAVAGLGDQKPTAPYDLSISFTQVVANPQIVAVAADGSSYTGGAHGAPLVARFVWLPEQNRRLTAAELVPDRSAWRDISGLVRDQLQAALVQRVDADHLPPADRADVLKQAGRMIAEGTGPDVANFSQFEPVLSPDGRIAALRFVFAPYQVGPYADGTQTVDIPADVLLPNIASGYRHLFIGG
ncbi:MAG: hypothetical protein JWL98_2163, partial [Xanthomonadaceae bacterium]|nr:hypothetical protein [Xanthomonadaceae bacterium]